MAGVREGIARELHRQARTNYRTRFVKRKSVNDLYEADLVDMASFSRVNRGFKFFLVVINCFSTYAIGKPLKSKNAVEVERHLKHIL